MWLKTFHLFDASLKGQENSVREWHEPQAEQFFLWLKIAMYHQCSQISLLIFSVQRYFLKRVEEKKKKKKSKLKSWWDAEMQHLQDTI